MDWNNAVGGAIIAAGASILTLLLGKETKVSEFRQKWINALREDLTIVVTHAFELQSADPQELAGPIFEMNRATTRIRLRLNPKEKLSKELLRKLADLREAFHNPDVVLSPNFFNEIEAKANGILDVSQLVLKKEWKRVKRGEVVFRLILISSICALITFSIDFIHPGSIHSVVHFLRR